MHSPYEHVNLSAVRSNLFSVLCCWVVTYGVVLSSGLPAFLLQGFPAIKAYMEAYKTRSAGRSKTESRRISIDADLAVQLDAEAANLQTTPSKLVRDAVHKYLAELKE